MSDNTTLVLGATENTSRYANMAIRSLREHNEPVVAVGRKAGQVLDIPIATDTDNIEQVDTVTLYLNPQNQEPYMDTILALKPRRVIFNPGTENPAFEAKLEAAGIEPVEACTLVMLRTGQY